MESMDEALKNVEVWFKGTGETSLETSVKYETSLETSVKF
jgi:hypothetical protein